MRNAMRQGRVILVGAGPGDPSLITVRGREWIAQADTLVYDNLVAEELVALAPQHAKRIYVGKVAGRHTMPQESINALLVEEAQRGDLVVRLKGGDPFVFGRGGEECLHLAEEGVPFEIVPGVSAAAAAPAYAGIPVTHRGMAAEFHVITGHEHAFKKRAEIDWRSVAALKGTLVIFMGLYRIHEIAENLIRHGRASDTPAAVIHRGTEPSQFSVAGPLCGIAKQAEEAGLRPPALVVIGEAVRLRERLAWFERKPLAGWRIAIPPTRMGHSRLADLLRERGARVVELCVREIVSAVDGRQEERRDERQDAASTLALQECDAVLFTGPERVAPLLRALLRQGQDARALSGKQLIAIGAATRVALNAFGLSPDIEEEILCSSILRRRLRKQGAEGLRILLPCGSETPSALVDDLARIGAEAIPMQLVEGSRPVAPALGGIDEDYDLFAIPCAANVATLREQFGDAALQVLSRRTPFAVVSPRAADLLRRLSVEAAVVARQTTIQALTEAIQAYAEAHRSEPSFPLDDPACVDLAQETM